MPDVQIFRPAIRAVPFEYEVPGRVELRLKQVYAEYDGSGAGADWLPCVTLLSDAGEVLGRAVSQGVKVTAGNDADVTWFPAVGGDTAAATTAPDYLVLTGTGQTVVRPPVGTSDHASFNAGTAESNSLSSWTLVLDGGGNVIEVDATTAGRYVSTCYYLWADPVAASEVTVIANIFGGASPQMSTSDLITTSDPYRGLVQAFGNLTAGTIQMTIEPSVNSGDASLDFDAVKWWILRYPT